MKLYFAPGSCGLASQIALRESEQKFELIKVDFATKTTTEGNYYEVTPKGYVPALKLDNGDILTEGAVILQWIADSNPKHKLLPEFGSRERYKALEWLNFVASDLHKGMGVMFSPFIDGDSKNRFAEGYMAPHFHYVENHLIHNEYVLGGTFSIADAYLYNVLTWAPRVDIDLSKYISIQKFMARMEQRSSVRDALAAEQL